MTRKVKVIAHSRQGGRVVTWDVDRVQEKIAEKMVKKLRVKSVLPRCERCGSTENLVVHHADGVHGALLPDETIILCRRCHALVHRTHDLRFFKLKEASDKLKEILQDV